MPQWRKTIKIGDLITDDGSPEAIVRAADGLVERLPPSAPLAGIRAARELAASDPDGALDEFNEALDRIYDWADRTRVWLSPW